MFQIYVFVVVQSVCLWPRKTKSLFCSEGGGAPYRHHTSCMTAYCMCLPNNNIPSEMIISLQLKITSWPGYTQEPTCPLPFMGSQIACLYFYFKKGRGMWFGENVLEPVSRLRRHTVSV